jgi:hypothetical protein
MGKRVGAFPGTCFAKAPPSILAPDLLATVHRAGGHWEAVRLRKTKKLMSDLGMWSSLTGLSNTIT